MYIDPTMLATATGVIGATAAAVWSYLMASRVAAPRAKRLIVEALTSDGPEVNAVREALITPALNASYERIDARTASGAHDVALEVERAVNASYEAFSNEIGPLVSRHIDMALKQAEAQQSKRVGMFLKEMGVDQQLEALEEGVREEALQAMGPTAQIAAEIMSTKIPKKASMVERTIMQFAKAQAASMLSGQVPGQAAGVVESSRPAGSGIGVR